MDTSSNKGNQLTSLQLELLKSLKYMATEKQLAEVRSLLKFYFTQQLDQSINQAENEKAYSAEVYNKWLEINVGGKDASAA